MCSVSVKPWHFSVHLTVPITTIIQDILITTFFRTTDRLLRPDEEHRKRFIEICAPIYSEEKVDLHQYFWCHKIPIRHRMEKDTLSSMASVPAITLRETLMLSKWQGTRGSWKTRSFWLKRADGAKKQSCFLIILTEILATLSYHSQH